MKAGWKFPPKPRPWAWALKPFSRGAFGRAPMPGCPIAGWARTGFAARRQPATPARTATPSLLVTVAMVLFSLVLTAFRMKPEGKDSIPGRLAPGLAPRRKRNNAPVIVPARIGPSKIVGASL